MTGRSRNRRKMCRCEPRRMLGHVVKMRTVIGHTKIVTAGIFHKNKNCPF